MIKHPIAHNLNTKSMWRNIARKGMRELANGANVDNPSVGRELRCLMMYHAISGTNIKNSQRY
jgi:hypothetical protein